MFTPLLPARAATAFALIVTGVSAAATACRSDPRPAGPSDGGVAVAFVDERIDFGPVRPASDVPGPGRFLPGPLAAEAVGGESSDRTPGGPRSSDPAGVLGTLRLPAGPTPFP